MILSQFYIPRMLLSSCSFLRSWAYTAMTKSSLGPLPSTKHTFTGLLLCAKHCAKLLRAPDSNLSHLHKNTPFSVPSSMFQYISFYTITLTPLPNLYPTGYLPSAYQHCITPFTFKKENKSSLSPHLSQVAAYFCSLLSPTFQKCCPHILTSYCTTHSIPEYLCPSILQYLAI